MSDSKQQSAGFSAFVRRFFHRGTSGSPRSDVDGSAAVPLSLTSPAQSIAARSVRDRAADDASVLTLASSSKRKRRSLDTNASMRGLIDESITTRSVTSASASVNVSEDLLEVHEFATTSEHASELVAPPEIADEHAPRL